MTREGQSHGLEEEPVSLTGSGGGLGESGSSYHTPTQWSETTLTPTQTSFTVIAHFSPNTTRIYENSQNTNIPENTQNTHEQI